MPSLFGFGNRVAACFFCFFPQAANTTLSKAKLYSSDYSSNFTVTVSSLKDVNCEEGAVVTAVRLKVLCSFFGS